MTAAQLRAAPDANRQLTTSRELYFAPCGFAPVSLNPLGARMKTGFLAFDLPSRWPPCWSRLLHVLFPGIQVDAITVSLIAIVPCLAPLFKSIELPGGVKVEFQELEEAKRRAA